jgi:hypothetical protein
MQWIICVHFRCGESCQCEWEGLQCDNGMGTNPETIPGPLHQTFPPRTQEPQRHHCSGNDHTQTSQFSTPLFSIPLSVVVSWKNPLFCKKRWLRTVGGSSLTNRYESTTNSSICGGEKRMLSPYVCNKPRMYYMFLKESGCFILSEGLICLICQGDRAHHNFKRCSVM